MGTPSLLQHIWILRRNTQVSSTDLIIFIIDGAIIDNISLSKVTKTNILQIISNDILQIKKENIISCLILKEALITLKLTFHLLFPSLAFKRSRKWPVKFGIIREPFLIYQKVVVFFIYFFIYLFL